MLYPWGSKVMVLIVRAQWRDVVIDASDQFNGSMVATVSPGALVPRGMCMQTSRLSTLCQVGSSRGVVIAARRRLVVVVVRVV